MVLRLYLVIVILGCAACSPRSKPPAQPLEKEQTMTNKTIKSDKEWTTILTPEQFHILREKGTERAFSGQYHDFKGKGVFVCAACGQTLFRSDEKFDSGTGWPSYWAPASTQAVKEHEDNSLFMKRTEVLCSACGGHLGHVFDDGPPPTGKRYCINSAALEFKGIIE